MPLLMTQRTDGRSKGSEAPRSARRLSDVRRQKVVARPDASTAVRHSLEPVNPGHSSSRGALERPSVGLRTVTRRIGHQLLFVSPIAAPSWDLQQKAGKVTLDGRQNF